MAKKLSIAEEIMANRATQENNPTSLPEKTTPGSSIAKDIMSKRAEQAERAEQMAAEQAERAEQMARMQLEQDLSGMVTRGMQRNLHTTMGQAYSAPRALDNITPTTPAEAAVSRSVDNARMEGLYKVEEERLKPLMDYLEAAELPEGYTAPNGQNIPHGDDLVGLIGANAGVTDTGPLYTNTNRLRAMYMLDPELAKGSTQVPWNEKYPQPTAP
ncbi:MAG: hypothetical protein J6C15_09980, partial [Bacteroidaceae bacterium]|nr:hypothetical protein [Bacteroidaceae bacterium]